MQQRAQERQNRSRVGGREQVLVDTVTQEGRVAGRTRDFRIVHLDGDEGLLGQTLEVEISASGPNSLVGKRPPTSH